MLDKKESNFIVRSFDDGDIIHVSQLISLCYRNMAVNEGYNKAEIDSLVRERGSIEAITSQCRQYAFWVAEINGQVIGAMAIYKNILEKLYVNPNFERQGIGKALFKTSECIMSKAGYPEMLFGAFPSSVKFYENMGAKSLSEKTIIAGPIKGHRIILMKKPLSE